MRKTIDPTKQVRFKKPADILILTGSVGSGHISVARAVTEALYRTNGKNLRVETIDLMTELKNFVTTATKKIYLGSLKLTPKFYEFLFRGSEDIEWPLQALNALSSPFMKEKFLELLAEKQPRLLISTYPVWDILARRCWDEYCSRPAQNGISHRRFLANARNDRKFVSIITDSMAVHGAWTAGKADYYLVANEDTKISLKNHGIQNKRIKVFGYPVAHRFHTHYSREDFQQKWNLSPKRKTLLLIFSTGTRWQKIKKLAAEIQAASLKNMQLVITASGEKSWERKLKLVKWPLPTRVTGWTNEMHMMIHGSDIVITKAGGATVMECIASGKPMIIFDAIPGQETGNATLVQKYNLGAVLNENVSDFGSALRNILANEARIKKNLKAQQRPRAAEDTAKFLLSLL